MILTIIFSLVLIASIIILWLNNEYWDYEIVLVSGLFFGLISLVGTFTILFVILGAQIPKNIEYERTQYERTQLIEQYENGNQYAYDSIIKFDKQLLSIKEWANNPFTSWFYNKKIADGVDFILYEENDFETGGN